MAVMLVWSSPRSSPVCGAARCCAKFAEQLLSSVGLFFARVGVKRGGKKYISYVSSTFVSYLGASGKALPLDTNSQYPALEGYVQIPCG
jgi:hypothetical protein